VAPGIEARRYSIGEALVAAGAPIPEAQALGSNYGERMRRKTGQKADEWLDERGWSRLGRKWIPPTS
jgi:hypothetical protein